jgi:hypothetical protein
MPERFPGLEEGFWRAGKGGIYIEIDNINDALLATLIKGFAIKRLLYKRRQLNY